MERPPELLSLQTQLISCRFIFNIYDTTVNQVYKTSKGFLVLSFLTLSLLSVSCKDKKDKAEVMPPVKVKVMEISPGESFINQEYTGTVASSETTTVSFSVAGTITELYAKEGQKVSKGQLLGKIRNGDYLNAYNIAVAQLAEAQDGYDRFKKLHDANALPDVKWVEIQQKLKQAQNAAEMAQRTLNDANLHSPVSGTVTQKFADVGQTIMPVQPIYEIVSTDLLDINVPVSETEIGDFSIGQKARIIFESNDSETIIGKVTQKSVEADPLTRSFNIKISLPASHGKILPGMIGSVVFERNDDKATDPYKGVCLPSQAVLLDYDNRWFVWVVKDSVAERRFVTADELATQGVWIKSGLNPGDKVIVEGVRKVGSGTKVSYSL